MEEQDSSLISPVDWLGNASCFEERASNRLIVETNGSGIEGFIFDKCKLGLLPESLKQRQSAADQDRRYRDFVLVD